MKKRGFVKITYDQFKKDVSKFNNNKDLFDNIKLPERKTIESAGYDFYSLLDFILKPGEIIKIPTAIKAYMGKDEYLTIIIRSSIGFKYNIRLTNQVGVIDSDYFNNEDNEGHIWISLQNEGKDNWTVNKGDRIVQGIFQKYLISEEEDSVSNKRKGGFGSTNIEEDR